MPVHNCPNCSYTSHRPFDLRRHLRRKIPCRLLNKDAIIDQKIPTNTNLTTSDEQNEVPNQENFKNNEQNEVPNQEIFKNCEQNEVPNQEIFKNCEQNEVPNQENFKNCEQNEVPDKQINRVVYCDKCEKSFFNNPSYIRHQQTCRGVKGNVCKICLKKFVNTAGRALHNRRVVCRPPPSQSPPPESSNAPQIINNNTTNNINNTTNNIDNSQNVNITLNFGQEALEKLCSHPDYMKRMEELVRLGKYALPQQISDIYFNDLFPMNNTIQKSRHNDRFVKIKTGDNEWNLRAMDDVYKTLTERMESYMTPYFSHVEKQMEKIYDEDQSKFKRLTRSIREFGHKVLWLDWKCEDIRQIGVELNDPYCENERHRRIQEMKSLLLEHIYEKTREMLSLQAFDNILQ